jgi:hypothetical protein
MTVVLCVLITLAFSFQTQAQKFEITPQYGYQVGAKWNYYGGYVKLKSSDQFGVTANIFLSDNLQAEFFWAQQSSAVAVKDVIFYPVEEEVTDATVDHFQLGIIHMFGYSDARPFVGMSAGCRVNCSFPCNGEEFTWAPAEEEYTREAVFCNSISQADLS